MNEHDDNQAEASSGAALGDDLLDAGLAGAWHAAEEVPPLDRRFERHSPLRIDAVLDLGGMAPATFASPEVAADVRRLEAAGRYVVQREVGRGGMGVVLAAMDRRLGRVVAVKLLYASTDDGARARRFIEEAQIAGQLQHPGIVPVYDVGLIDSRRPYISMKFVEGRTLAVGLRERSDTVDRIERLLDVVGRTAEALAYAHARGVVHRDLKPSNVLLGAFGEVIVTDWGLAKVIDGSTTDSGSTAPAPLPDGIRTIRSLDQSLTTASGTVMGTPAYMAPEQAVGDPAAVGATADVFALGGLLCEILTGKPPFFGRSVDDLRRIPAPDLLAPALERLDTCGHDAALVALTRECLAVDPAQRPPDAGVVASRVATLRASHHQRARDVFAASQAAVAVAATERRHVRRVAAMAVLTAAAVVAVAVTWTIVTARDRLRRDDAVARAADHRRNAEKLVRDERFEEASAEAFRAVDVLSAADAERACLDDATAFARSVEAALERHRIVAARAKVEDDLIATLARLRVARFENDDLAVIDRRYDAALSVLQSGETPQLTDAVVAAVRRDEIVQGLFDWWLLRRYAFATVEERLVAPVLKSLLNCERREDHALVVRKLAGGDVAGAVNEIVDDAESYDAPFLAGVSLAVSRTLGVEREGDFLRRAATAHPREYLLRFNLGLALSRMKPPRWDDALLEFSAADALSSDRGMAAQNIGICLNWLDRHTDAVPFFERATTAAPERASGWIGLASVLAATGQLDRADAAVARAERTAPEALRLQIRRVEADVLIRREKFDAALPHLDAVLAKTPDDWRSLFQRADAALRTERSAEAAADLERCLKLKPDHWRARYRLGTHLYVAGRPADALEHLQAAVKLRPSHAPSQINLGQCLVRLGRPEEGIGRLMIGKELGAPPGVPIDEYIAACLRAFDER